MAAPAFVARILLVAPEVGKRPDRSGDTFALLSRLGREFQLTRVRDAASGVEVARADSVDLVVLDRVSRSEATLVLDALAESGPPVLVVTEEDGEAAALEAFRGGAAECVRVDPNFEEVLPVVVLEQLRCCGMERERGAAERRIRDLQRYNDNIIQNLNSALLVVDSDGLIVTANQVADEILGVETGMLLGRFVWDWLCDESSEESVIGRTLAEGVRFDGAETTLRRDDGTILPIGISCSPTTVPRDGAPTSSAPVRPGAVAIFRDLSDIRRLQTQVLQTAKMASIGQLAAGVAHEINNPMGFIHANLFQMGEYLGDLRHAWERVEALQKAVRVGGSAEIRAASDALSETCREVDLDFIQADFAKAVRESQDGAERIRHIVRDLREFSHHDVSECIEVDIIQCLDSTASIAWTMMKHSVTLEKAYSELPKVRCYPMQLKEVFMNLLVNAYQAIEQKVGTSGELGVIHIRTEQRGDAVAIAIRDTGAGIDPKDLDRIFDPFFTTKEVGAGTGLGLSNSYRIVQRHEGRIDVESVPGEGTTFTIWLPISGPARVSGAG